MSELTDRYKEAVAARFKDLAPRMLEADADFRDTMDNLAAHHECPEKRVKRTCRCALND